MKKNEKMIEFVELTEEQLVEVSGGKHVHHQHRRTNSAKAPTPQIAKRHGSHHHR